MRRFKVRNFKSRIKRIEEKLEPEKSFVTLFGDSKTNFDKLIEEHIEKTGCDPQKTLFVCVINSFSC